MVHARVHGKAKPQPLRFQRLVKRAEEPIGRARLIVKKEPQVIPLQIDFADRVGTAVKGNVAAFGSVRWRAFQRQERECDQARADH